MPLCTLFLGLCLAASARAEFDHGLWDELLKSHVVESAGASVTAVDYSAFQRERARLKEYLQALAKVTADDFSAWSVDEQLAFLINAYNAWTVELILTEYPEIDSIRDIGFLPGAPWRRKIVSLFSSSISLDELEHEMIRGWPRFQEPRIHFAVNCAAVGCPALRKEAYLGAALDEQLESSTNRFLADRNRNYLRESTLYVSRIFDWYEEDFQKGWLGVSSVAEFLARYAEPLGLTDQEAAELLAGRIRIRYLSYDWQLNDSARSAQ